MVRYIESGVGCEDLDVIDHCEDGVFVDAGREVVGREEGEADAFKRTRHALSRVDVLLVEAGQNALHLQLILAVFQQVDKVFARQRVVRGGELRRRDKECQSLLICHVPTPSFTHVFHQPGYSIAIYMFTCRDVRSNT